MTKCRLKHQFNNVEGQAGYISSYITSKASFPIVPSL